MMQSNPSAFVAWTMIAQEQPAKNNPVMMPDSEGEGAKLGSATQQPGDPSRAVGPAGAAQPASPFSGMGMLLIIGVFFGFMILTQIMSSNKEKKRRQALMSGLSKGDRVVTMGGIIGDVAEIGDDSIVIRLEDGRMRISKAAIQSVVPSREHAKSNVGELEVKTASREKTTA